MAWICFWEHFLNYQTIVFISQSLLKKTVKHNFPVLYLRSLVALSLILAMLLFKPAPIYILDEVDAALDLSHTQNIGHMIYTYFRHSQVWSWSYCGHPFLYFIVFRAVCHSGVLAVQVFYFSVLYLSCFNWKLHWRYGNYETCECYVLI